MPLIYFIEGEGAGLIKIGYTDGDPEGRLSVLQVGSCVRLLRLALMRGTRKAEGQIHTRFRGDRSHGEWFRNTPRLRAFMEENAVAWIGPIVEGGSMIPTQTLQDWSEILAYTEGIPGLEGQLEELWPRYCGVKIPIDPARR